MTLQMTTAGCCVKCAMAHNDCRVTLLSRMSQTLQALKGMHKQNLGVCDLKPENILVHFHTEGTFAVECTVIDLGGCAEYEGNCGIPLPPAQRSGLVMHCSQFIFGLPHRGLTQDLMRQSLWQHAQAF